MHHREEQGRRSDRLGRAAGYPKGLVVVLGSSGGPEDQEETNHPSPDLCHLQRPPGAALEVVGTRTHPIRLNTRRPKMARSSLLVLALALLPSLLQLVPALGFVSEMAMHSPVQKSLHHVGWVTGKPER